ncbi:MAG: tRNA (N6-threonylcarbamoyladenosine(37)-N6)-methyltransferase TrmO [Anaerolineae bacterium]|nr:tRNA (N6-threonylcarbamoyladenosine(37)-N6)-methyltransferase TrmO [Anaerolineae bacterium]
MDFRIQPIGLIHTPFKTLADTPIQSSRSNASGEIEVFSQYEQGLESLDGLSHIFLIYVFHHALDSQDLMVKPLLDKKKHGVFSTRYFRRPNPIGLSIVRLIRRDGLRLHIQSVDMLDATPLIDIKPYVPEFDIRVVEKIGWYDNRAYS